MLALDTYLEGKKKKTNTKVQTKVNRGKTRGTNEETEREDTELKQYH